MSTTALMTFAEFEKLPESPGKQELIDGELVEIPPAKRAHLRTATKIQQWLIRSVGDDERVWLEGGYKIKRGWLVPDVSLAWPDQPEENGYLTKAPQLAIEVLSPSNSAEQIDRKVTAYLDDGAEEVWVVYPRVRSMMVYKKTSGDEIEAHRVSGKYRSSLVGAELDLDAVIALAR